MNHIAQKGRRLFATVMAAVMLASLIPAITPETEAAWNGSVNAPFAGMDLLDTTDNLFAATPGGAMLRVIDGQLWVWGKNTGYGTGLATYNNEATNGSTVISSPVKHDFDFGSDIVKVMTSCNSGVTVLTANGDLYSWGSIFSQYVFSAKSGVSPDGGRTPVKWDKSQVQGTLTDVYSSSLAISVKDDQDNWYVAGSLNGGYSVANMVQDTTAANIMVLKPLSTTFIDKLQKSWNGTAVTDTAEQEGGNMRRKVLAVYPSYGGGSSFVVTDDPAGNSEGAINGKILFSLGHNNHGQNLQPETLSNDVLAKQQDLVAQINANPGATSYTVGGVSVMRGSEEYYTILKGETYGAYGASNNPVNLFADPQNWELKDAGPDLDTFMTEGHNSSIIDRSGNVWMVGDSASNLYPAGTRYRRPVKVYNAVENGAKAKKVFTSSATAVFLTEDNSLYAIGKNANQYITTLETETANIHNYTQVFTDLSKSQTITGVYPTDLGVMVVTKSGEQYWAGDNSGGTAGNGTTESPKPGTVEESIPKTIPPNPPTTANEITFEIQTAGADSSETARLYEMVDDNGTPKLQRTVVFADKNAANEVNIIDPTQMILKAGSTFKLNVYFNDFGKINEWVVPIRFNANLVQVTNTNGVAYSKDVEYKTPGAINGTTGINQEFTSQDWSYGTLVGAGGTDGTYPKISNRDGWVSVMGLTTDTKASINGKVKMFSVTFTAVASTSGTDLATFQICTESNGTGYDHTAISTLDHGPGWIVTNTASETEMGAFPFNYPLGVGNAFPKFKTQLKLLTSLDLGVRRAGDAESEMAQSTVSFNDYTTGDPRPSQADKAVAIDRNNRSEVYTVSVKPQPTDASFPQVDWTMSLSYPDLTAGGATSSEGMEASDFLTVTETGETYIRFKVNSALEYPNDAVIKIAATSRRTNTVGQKATNYVNIVLTTFDSPSKIGIMEADTRLTDRTITYTGINADAADTEFADLNNLRVFHIYFPEAQGADINVSALDVTVRLFDSQGNEYEDVTSVDNPVAVQNVIQPVGQLPNVTLQGSFTLAPQHTTKGNTYVTVRVESLYDPTVYSEMKVMVHRHITQLKFTAEDLVMPTDSGYDLLDMLQMGPEGEIYEYNLDWSFTPADGSSPKVIFNGTQYVTSGEEFHSDLASDVDKVTVTDTISGVSASINIKVKSIKSPIPVGQMSVENLVGTKDDYLEISGLELGDIIKVYPEYGGIDDGTELTFPALTITQIPTRRFPLPDFLNGGGGRVGVKVIRYNNANHPEQGYNDAVDQVPVPYKSEPSKVYGYVSLAGKLPGSPLLEGITVQLTDGLSNPDPVVTDSRGYFEFRSYIAPGDYTLIVSKNNYLKRVIATDPSKGYNGITITAADEFAISTEKDPIVLYPGDVVVDGAINSNDVDYYVRNWVGLTDSTISRFAEYDFYDEADPVIDLFDLDMVTRHNGWISGNYPKWYVPSTR